MTNKLEPHVLPVYVWPSEKLRVKPKTVNTFDQNTEQVALDMFTTIRANNAIGLAGPQVGIEARVIALWVDNNEPIFLANPQIIEVDDNKTFTFEEGCLSVPGYFEERTRPWRVVAKYQDITGNKRTFEFRDIFAFALQHEMEHLKGKLFIDELSRLKKLRIKSRIKKYIATQTKKTK